MNFKLTFDIYQQRKCVYLGISAPIVYTGKVKIYITLCYILFSQDWYYSKRREMQVQLYLTLLTMFNILTILTIFNHIFIQINK